MKKSIYRFAFPLLLLLVPVTEQVRASQSGPENARDSERAEPAWAIALHGGAGVISRNLPEETRQGYFEALEEALETGEQILESGGSALDAVEQVVRYLEDHPRFNAGRGSVFTDEGKHELDAAIMDGSTLEAGALTGLTTVRHPVTLARHVMENSRHILFSGAGAEEYANQAGVERVENEWFSTENRRQQWDRSRGQGSNLSPGTRTPEEVMNDRYGTVGAVALDQNGKLAAATSTGGMTGKRFGRVGDVPIIGSGTYANHLVAISATGWGEQIMRHVSGHTIAARMEFAGDTLEEALDFLLEERMNPGDAGFIAVDRDGNLSMKMNTAGMFRAGANSEGERTIAIWEDGDR
ncbi:MAG: isoaspartyl peptidase/L-asparaginase [Balneolaceae bacterium]